MNIITFPTEQTILVYFVLIMNLLFANIYYLI